MGLLAISNQCVPQARYISRTHPHNKNALPTLYQAESTQFSIFNFQLPMKPLLSLLAFLALALSLFANGDPVATFCALTLSRNPIGVHVPEVQLKDEHLTVTPVGRYTLVRVEYLLYNNSKKDFVNLPYGFPIDYYRHGSERWASLDGNSESVAEVGWRDDYITEVAFTLNGIQLPFQISADSLLKAGRPLLTPAEAAKDKNGDLFETRLDSINYALYKYESDLLRRWYYTQSAPWTLPICLRLLSRLLLGQWQGRDLRCAGRCLACAHRAQFRGHKQLCSPWPLYAQDKGRPLALHLTQLRPCQGRAIKLLLLV